jgi:hypothetical protein
MLTTGTGAMSPAELAEAAARVLCLRGYGDPHDAGERPGGLAGELAELAGAGCCTSCPVTLTPDAVADHWLARKEDEHDRALPTWACDCGAVYKVVSEWGGNSDFYVGGRRRAAWPAVRGRGAARH